MKKSNEAEELIDEIDALAGTQDTISVGDVIEAIGNRGFGPLLFVPALVVVSPLGGIPAVPTLFALIIAMIAVQVLLGRGHIWLPSILRQRAVADDRVAKSAKKARPVAKWMDRWFGKRLEAMAGDAVQKVAAVMVLGLCLTVPPLEVVPFAAAVPMLAIAVIGLAITARDGVLMLIGLAGGSLALIAGLTMISG